jgi:trk system potassium uptake protein TrkH
VLVNLTVAILIILGGLSFTVLLDLFHLFKNRAYKLITGQQQKLFRPSLNTKIVLITTGVLILAGMMIIYPFEHKTTLIRFDLKTQYLAAFFQSVTLRTAGFNTIDFSTLNRFTYLIMILFMFVGGASGSTAGGVKVNTVAIIGGYIKATIGNKEDVTIFNQTLSNDLVNKALFIVFIYSIVIFLSTIILSMTENFEIVPILFEVVSAIGTVGLSSGITPGLSSAGKVIIIILMFVGRVGPLTIVLSLSQRQRITRIGYPKGNIALG